MTVITRKAGMTPEQMAAWHELRRRGVPKDFTLKTAYKEAQKLVRAGEVSDVNHGLRLLAKSRFGCQWRRLRQLLTLGRLQPKRPTVPTLPDEEPAAS